MSIERVLQRVDDDLARGHTFVAIQRLATLVHQHPADANVRARLARIHLQTGNLVEAGRWSYLAEDRDDAAVTAFERAFRHPGARLASLRWAAPVEESTPSGQARLRELEAAALALPTEPGRPLQEAGGSDWIAGLAFASVIFAVLALIAIGLITVIRWIF